LAVVFIDFSLEGLIISFNFGKEFLCIQFFSGFKIEKSGGKAASKTERAEGNSFSPSSAPQKRWGLLFEYVDNWLRIPEPRAQRPRS
jgi:hypothetical protein